MDLTNKLSYFVAAIIGILTVGLYIGFTQVWTCLFLLLLLMVWMNNSERSIVLLLFGKKLLGIICQFYHIPIPGSIIALGLALLFSWKFALSKFILNPRWKYMIYVLAIFTAFYSLTNHTPYAIQKYTELFTTGICVFFVYSLLSHDSNVSPQKISMAFILYALFLFAFAFDFYGFPHPSSIADVGFYRDTCMLMAYHNEIAVGLEYQELGMTGLLSLVFWASNKDKLKISDISILLLISWITLLSGSRQAIFSIIIVAFIWSALRMEKVSLMSLIVMTMVVSAAYFLMFSFQTDSMNRALLSNGTLDDRLGGRSFAISLQIFSQYPIFGCGFGLFENFNTINQSPYPHNIFFEILSEMGFVGFLLLITPVLIIIRRNKFRFRDKYANGSWFIMIFMAYFIRANISGSLGENIVLFVLLFTFVPLKNELDSTNVPNKI